jgi:Ca2+-binding EF-hand superfamily protein
VVTAREVRKDRAWAAKQAATVNTPWEAKADRDHDGIVEPAEVTRARELGYGRTLSAVNRPWEKAADLNHNGKVDASELRTFHLTHLDVNHDGIITPAEHRAYWLQNRAVADTMLEKRYDANGDGYLNWIEARAMFKDRKIIIATNGKAIVSNDIELAFDANKDGVIDRDEAALLQAALDAN